jgi:hypothetical protein
MGGPLLAVAPGQWLAPHYVAIMIPVAGLPPTCSRLNAPWATVVGFIPLRMLLLLALAVVPALLSLGQVRLEWTQEVGTTRGPIAVDSEGNVCVATTEYNTNTSATDLVLWKLAPNGALLWTTRYFCNSGEVAVPYKLAVDAAGNVHVGGELGVTLFGISLVRNALLADCGPDGSGSLGGTRWGVRHLTYLYDFAVTPGDCFIGGDFSNPDSTSEDPPMGFAYHNGSWLVKSLEFFPYAVTADASGSIYLTGQERTNAQTGFMRTAKYSADNTLLWSNLINTNSSGSAIATGLGGDVFVAGWTNLDALVVKYDAAGAPQWQSTISGAYAGDILVDSENNLVHGYQLRSSHGWNVTKYRSDGLVAWTRTRLTDWNFILYGLAKDSSNSIYLAGNLQTNDLGDTQIVLVKYSAQGDLLWETNYAATGFRDTAASSFAVTSQGDVYIFGTLDYGTPSFLLKYGQARAAAQLALRPASALGGPILLSVFAKAGQTFRVETSNDLLQWSLLTNVLNVTGTFEFLDPEPRRSQKYYRVVSQ